MISNIRLFLPTGLLCLLLTNACVPRPSISITDKTHLPEFKEKLSFAKNQSSTLSLRGIPQRVKNNNPQLAAARKTIEMAKGKLSQSGRLENPELSIGSNLGIPVQTGGEIELSFGQRFPVTNKLSLEKRVHRDSVFIAQSEVEINELQLTAKAQMLAVELLGKERQIALLDKQKKAYQSVVDWITETAKRGEISKLQANVPRIEIRAIDLKQKQLLNQKQLITHQLKGLIGMPVGSSLSITGSLPDVSLPSSSLNLKKHPSYIARQHMVAQSKSSLLLAKANRYEDPEIQFTGSIIREEDEPVGLETEGTIGIGLSIPLPLYDKNEGNIQSATARAEKEILELHALSASLKNEAAKHRLSMKSWLKQNEEIKKRVLPLARQNAKQLKNAYQQGQGDYLTFLQASKQTIELEKQLLENTIEFHRAKVLYFHAIGQPQSTF